MLLKTCFLVVHSVKACRIFILSACFALSAQAFGSDFRPLENPRVTAEIILDALQAGQNFVADRLYAFAMENTPMTQDNRLATATARAQLVKALFQDRVWRSQSVQQRLRYIEIFLKAGPLTPVLQRELLFLALNKTDEAGLEFLLHLRAHWVNPRDLAVEGAVPSILSPWMRWRGRLVPGDRFLTHADISVMAVRWLREHDTEPLNPCESQLTRRP